MKTFHRYSTIELDLILKNHLHWLMEDCTELLPLRANLYRTDFSGMDLRGCILSSATISYSNMKETDLSNADLSDTDLRYTNFKNANLTGTDLSYANLFGCNFTNTDLSYANLKFANLNGAIFSNTNLLNTNLYHAYYGDDTFIKCEIDKAKNLFIPMACPTHGSFIGWKKCKGNTLVKLLIPENAKRSSAAGRKCRCDKALVLDIYDVANTKPGEKWKEITETKSMYDWDFIYRVGEMVIPNSYDENRWKDCSNGIHFFITAEEALRY